MNIAPAILNSSFLRQSISAQRYWNSLATRMSGRVDLVDPGRLPLRELRKIPEFHGLTVYRASTGGRWSKSAQIVKI